MLVPERATIEGVAGRMPCGPDPAVASVDYIPVVNPLRADRRAVRGVRSRVIDGIGRGKRRRGGEDQQRRDCEQRRKHEAGRLAGRAAGQQADLDPPPALGV